MIINIIDLNDTTKFQELKKVIEEDNEFRKAVVKGTDRDNILEEFYDSVQSKIQILEIMGFTKGEVHRALLKHREKLDKRGHAYKDVWYL